MLSFRTVVIVALALGVIAAIALPLAALLHRWSLLSLSAAFSLLGASVLVAVVVLAVAIYTSAVALARGLGFESGLSIGALLLAGIELVVIGLFAYRAFTLPLIHDITTDGIDVPEFDVAHGLRRESDHVLTYGDDLHSPVELWTMQKRAYPGVRTIRSALDSAAAFERARALLAEQGLEVVNEDREAGRIEAVATSFWFGFKDDLVVRVRAGEGGTRVDVRSVSRVGQSDLGANAARIERFIAAFGD